MTNEELVKALRYCMTKEDGITICEPCPYYGKGIECENVLHTDAAAAIEALQEQVRMLDKHDTDLRNEGYDVGYYAGRRDWEPKRGEWVYNDGDYIPYCSICGMPQDTETPYCHFCGAKMEVQE